LSCEGSGTLAGVIAGIDWATAQATESGRPSVISMSLGGPRSSIENTAVARAHAANVVVVVAAGNDDADACFSSPASAVEALTVGSTTISDSRSSFSNWGPCVDLWARSSARALVAIRRGAR